MPEDTCVSKSQQGGAKTRLGDLVQSGSGGCNSAATVGSRKGILEKRKIFRRKCVQHWWMMCHQRLLGNSGEEVTNLGEANLEPDEVKQLDQLISK